MQRGAIANYAHNVRSRDSSLAATFASPTETRLNISYRDSGLSQMFKLVVSTTSKKILKDINAVVREQVK